MTDKNYNKPDVLIYQDFYNAITRGQDFSNFRGEADIKAFLAAFAKSGKTPTKTDIYELYSKLTEGDYMGASAYEIWLDQGNVGTVQDFLNSLVGPDGKSAYTIWLELGNIGTEADFITSLIGVDGKSAYDIWLEQGNTGTPDDFLGWLQSGRLFWVSFEDVSTLVVEHNLNRYPATYVLDQSLIQCEVMVTHLSDTQLRITMNAPMTGWVFCQ